MDFDIIVQVFHTIPYIRRIQSVKSFIFLYKYKTVRAISTLTCFKFYLYFVLVLIIIWQFESLLTQSFAFYIDL